MLLLKKRKLVLVEVRREKRRLGRALVYCRVSLLMMVPATAYLSMCACCFCLKACAYRRNKWLFSLPPGPWCWAPKTSGPAHRHRKVRFRNYSLRNISGFGTLSPSRFSPRYLSKLSIGVCLICCLFSKTLLSLNTNLEVFRPRYTPILNCPFFLRVHHRDLWERENRLVSQSFRCDFTL